MKKIPKTFYLVSYGKIGDALMDALFLDIFHAQFPDTRIVILATRSVSLMSEVFRSYLFIEVKKLSSWNVSVEIFRSWGNGSRPAVVLPPLFGVTPFYTYLLARKLAWSSFGRLFAFRYKTKGLGRFRIGVSGFIDFSVDELYLNNLLKIIPAIGGISQKITAFPKYRYEKVATDKLTTDTDSGVSHTIVVFPFAAKEYRTLPVDRWNTILHVLAEKLPAYTFTVIGGLSDRSRAEAITANLPADRFSLFLGRGIAESASLIDASGLFLGVDSGITHLASVIDSKVPVVEIGNMSNPTCLPTYNPRVQILVETANCGCNGDFTGKCEIEYKGQKYLRCMFDVSDQRIIDTVVNALLN